MYVFEGKDYSKEPSAADCQAFQHLVDGNYLPYIIVSPPFCRPVSLALPHVRPGATVPPYGSLIMLEW